MIPAGTFPLLPGLRSAKTKRIPRGYAVRAKPGPRLGPEPRVTRGSSVTSGGTGSDAGWQAERQRSLGARRGLPAGACGLHHAGSGTMN